MTYGITDSIIHEVTDDFKDDVLDEIADVKDEVKDAWEDSWEDDWEDSWDDDWGGHNGCNKTYFGKLFHASSPFFPLNILLNRPTIFLGVLGGFLGLFVGTAVTGGVLFILALLLLGIGIGELFIIPLVGMCLIGAGLLLLGLAIFFPLFHSHPDLL